MTPDYLTREVCTHRRIGLCVTFGRNLVASGVVVSAAIVLTNHLNLQAAAPPMFRVPVLSELRGRHIDQPVVETRIAGFQALLMLDSGADTTVVDESLIQPGMQLKKPPEANSGNDNLRLAENVPLQIGNYSLTLSVVAFTKLGDPLVHDYGIRGILSAQAVLDSVALLFDFPHHVILGFATTDDLRAQLRENDSATSILQIPVRSTEGELYVEASVSSHAPTWLLLDTGGGHTYFPRSAVSAFEAGEVRTFSEFDGRSKKYLVVPNQSIIIGGRTFGPMAVTTGTEVKGGAAEEEGRLGVDFLSGFGVAFPRGKAKEIWLVMHK